MTLPANRTHIKGWHRYRRGVAVIPLFRHARVGDCRAPTSRVGRSDGLCHWAVYSVSEFVDTESSWPDVAVLKWRAHCGGAGPTEAGLAISRGIETAEGQFAEWECKVRTGRLPRAGCHALGGCGQPAENRDPFVALMWGPIRANSVVETLNSKCPVPPVWLTASPRFPETVSARK